MKAVTDTKYYNEIAKKIQSYGSNVKMNPSDMAAEIDNIAQKIYEDGKIAALESEKTTAFFEGSYTITDGVDRTISSLTLYNINALPSVTIEFTDGTETLLQSVTVAFYGGSADYLIYKNKRVVKGNDADGFEEDITDTTEGQAIMALYTYEGITSIICNASCQIEYTKNVLKEQYNSGRKARYDEFWNDYQGNGGMVNYTRAFEGPRWTDKTFNPKHDILATNFQACFHSNSNITRIPVLVDISTADSVSQGFYGCSNLATLKLKTSETTPFAANTFQACSVLENLSIEGTIGQSFSLSDSPLLSETSLSNIVEHLATVSVATTLTLHKTAKAKLADAQIATIQEKGWTLA